MSLYILYIRNVEQNRIDCFRMGHWRLTLFHIFLYVFNMISNDKRVGDCAVFFAIAKFHFPSFLLWPLYCSFPILADNYILTSSFSCSLFELCVYSAQIIYRILKVRHYIYQCCCSVLSSYKYLVPIWNPLPPTPFVSISICYYVILVVVSSPKSHWIPMYLSHFPTSKAAKWPWDTVHLGQGITTASHLPHPSGHALPHTD